MEIVREAAAVIIVFGLLAAFLILGKRAQWIVPALQRRSKTGAARMELIESLRIGPHHSIHLLRVDEASVLIAAHSSGCTLLSRPNGEPHANTPADVG